LRNTIKFQSTELIGAAFMIVLSAVFVAAFSTILQPLLLLLLIAVIIVGGLVLCFAYLSPGAPVWVRLFVMAVFFLLLLDKGFSSITFGSGDARVTLGESAVILAFLASLNRNARLLTASPLCLSLLVASIGPLAIHLVADFNTYGIGAARDALHQVDMLAFFAGAGVCLTGHRLGRWELWRDRFWICQILIGGLYLASYPFLAEVIRYSPLVFAYQQRVPMFGYYPSAMIWWGTLAIFMRRDLLGGAPGTSRLIKLALLGIFCMDFLLLQSRSLYVIVPITCVLLLIWGYRRVVLKLSSIVAAGVIAVVVLDAGGFVLKGRVGRLGMDTIVAQIQSISGGEEGDRSGAYGVRQRAEWREKSLSLWSADAGTILFGIGYGVPLTDFTTEDILGHTVVVREPHNSYLTMLTRTGLLGFGAWLAFLAGILIKTRGLAQVTDKSKPKDTTYYDWLFLFFSCYLVTAFVEPVFEAPNLAIVLYFWFGTAFGDSVQASKERALSASSGVTYRSR
jgi:O-Antigen ligase